MGDTTQQLLLAAAGVGGNGGSPPAAGHGHSGGGSQQVLTLDTLKTEMAKLFDERLRANEDAKRDRSPPQRSAAAAAAAAAPTTSTAVPNTGEGAMLAQFIKLVSDGKLQEGFKAQIDSYAHNPRVQRAHANLVWFEQVIVTHGVNSDQHKAAKEALTKMHSAEAATDGKRSETWRQAHRDLVADAIRIDQSLATIVSGINVNTVAKSYSSYSSGGGSYRASSSSSSSSSSSRNYSSRKRSRSRSRSRSHSPRRSSSSSSSSRKCHRCQEPGHMAAKCPAKSPVRPMK